MQNLRRMKLEGGNARIACLLGAVDRGRERGRLTLVAGCLGLSDRGCDCEEVQEVGIGSDGCCHPSLQGGENLGPESDSFLQNRGRERDSLTQGRRGSRWV